MHFAATVWNRTYSENKGIGRGWKSLFFIFLKTVRSASQVNGRSSTVNAGNEEGTSMTGMPRVFDAVGGAWGRFSDVRWSLMILAGVRQDGDTIASLPQTEG